MSEKLWPDVYDACEKCGHVKPKAGACYQCNLIPTPTPTTVIRNVKELLTELSQLRAENERLKKERDDAMGEMTRLKNRTVEHFIWLRDDSSLWQAAQLFAEKYNTTEVQVGLVMLREKATYLLCCRDALAESLLPLVQIANGWTHRLDELPDEAAIYCDDLNRSYYAGQLRKARAALSGSAEKGGG